MRLDSTTAQSTSKQRVSDLSGGVVAVYAERTDRTKTQKSPVWFCRMLRCAALLCAALLCFCFASLLVAACSTDGVRRHYSDSGDTSSQAPPLEGRLRVGVTAVSICPAQRVGHSEAAISCVAAARAARSFVGLGGLVRGGLGGGGAGVGYLGVGRTGVRGGGGGGGGEGGGGG